jgi:hypothetical protein
MKFLIGMWNHSEPHTKGVGGALIDAEVSLENKKKKALGSLK